jgi:NitT/TauT family transport system ATP-binding protein
MPSDPHVRQAFVEAKPIVGAAGLTQMDIADAAVTVQDVQKVYATGLQAISAINFAVRRSEFVSFLGPSGCGKSTLLMMIAGLLKPTSGCVSIEGEPVNGPRKDVSVVFQSPVLLPWRTVLQNLRLPIELMGLEPAGFAERARHLLGMTKLSAFADALPSQLSGGMRQRVAICRALIHNPSILLMDEPFSALDAMTRDELGLELQRIWDREKKTVLFVTHGIREAIFLSDRVLVMAQRPGRIVQDIKIDLPRPRGLEIQETDEFNAYVSTLRKSINASHEL